MKKHQIPVEIHTHTNHSDALFTVEELVDAAKNFGYKGIILTDHNSSSGYNEMLAKGLTDSEDLLIVKGMEWTTYFGHMLALNADYDVDWRDATPHTIDKHIKEVKDAKGLVGIAHPFDMGSPICTGCHWDFKVTDYENVDFIEIWNSNHPHIRPESKAAYEMWLSLLDEGYHISASTGRDWHRHDKTEEIMGVTYLELDDKKLTRDNFMEAIANGHFYLSLGPICEFNLRDDQNNMYYIGDEVLLSTVQDLNFEITILPSEITWYQNFEINDMTFVLYNNREIIFEKTFEEIFHQKLIIGENINTNIEPGYIRFELKGNMNGETAIQLLISNPIYFN